MKYIIVIMALTLVACFGKRPETTGMEGKRLPEFSFLLADSSTWVNTKDIPQGKPSAFFLFTPHCPYCKSQMSKIINDIESLKDITIYAITPSQFKEVKEFYNAYALYKYPNIKVGRDTAGFLGMYLDVKGVPFLALYDKNKQLSRAFSGVTNTNLIKAIIAE